MNSFHELFHRYINRTATEEEREAFFVMVASGRYDDMIKECLGEMIDAVPERISGDEKMLYDSGQEIYASLRQKNRIPFGVKADPPHVTAWIWISAAAVIAVAVVAYLWMMTKDPAPSRHMIVQREAPKPAVYSGKQVFDLPDGTQVILNENSELAYGESFGASTREVILAGEASFDVTNDPSRPFIVRTGKVNTKVLGTAFNISAYPEQNEITVTVLRGLVEVGDDQQVYGEIRPDQQIEVNTTTYAFVRRDANADEAVVWQSDFLVLDDVTLEEAAARIGKKFGVKITFENPALKNCKFYGSFLNDEDLTDILTMMGPVLHIDHKIENGIVTISGKGCHLQQQ